LSGKLFIIGCSGIPPRYGGFETFAENLALQLQEELKIYIACSKNKYKQEERRSEYKSIQRFFIGFRANGIWSLLYDLASVSIAFRSTTEKDYILVLGIASGFFLPVFSCFGNRNLIIHMDGLEWKRKKWKTPARLFLRICRILSLRYADTILLDNKAMLAGISHKYQDKVKLITYGWEHLPKEEAYPKPVSFNYALLIARAEPENNLEMIMDVFTGFTDLKLIAITNAGETKHGRFLIKRFSGNENILFIDAIYDRPELLNAYRMNCTLYIHGHSAGGTNPSLIEAMACGLTITAWDNDFNRIASGNRLSYFLNRESLTRNISTHLKNAASIPDRNLQDFTRKNYSWKKVAEDFRSVLSGDTV
jgi:glycosyltransferase involved in cell wall biosynthesis